MHKFRERNFKRLMPRVGDSGLPDGFRVWAVMMIGMMVPSVAPWVLALCGISARNPKAGPLFSAGGFLMGYLAVWTAYSFLAAGLQWGLHTITLLSPQLRGASPAPEERCC